MASLKEYPSFCPSVLPPLAVHSWTVHPYAYFGTYFASDCASFNGGITSLK